MFYGHTDVYLYVYIFVYLKLDISFYEYVKITWHVFYLSLYLFTRWVPLVTSWLETIQVQFVYHLLGSYPAGNPSKEKYVYQQCFGDPGPLYMRMTHLPLNSPSSPLSPCATCRPSDPRIPNVQWPWCRWRCRSLVGDGGSAWLGLTPCGGWVKHD